MMTGVEGIGEAVTGGMAARAVEPEAGEGEGHTGETRCLNCGCELVGAHCHCCGQRAHVHRTIGAWWHDFVHSVLHLDGKFWRTLPLLAWRPGELTRRYVEGERARFVSPMALFLFSVFMTFAVFSLIGADIVGMDDAAEADVSAELVKQEQEVERLEAARAAAAAKGEAAAAVEASLEEAKRARDTIAATNKYFGGEEGKLIGGEIDTGWPRLDKGLKKANENPSLLFYKVQANAYKFSWALIPISVPFLWLLFLHRRRYRAFHGYDHVVFVTYSIAFMSMALIALTLLGTIGLGAGWVLLLGLLIPPLHIYRQLRGAYALDRFSALWRTAALLFFATIAVNLFMLLLLALGVLA